MALIGLFGWSSEAAEAAVITVTTADGGPANVDGQCSLREAIGNARQNALSNADCLVAGEAAPALDEIRFNVGGGGVQTIPLTSALATLSGGPLLVDATTQPGGGTLPRIVLDGAGTGAGVDGFQVTGADVTVRGFAIIRFSGSGIQITAGAQRAIVEGNHIGVDETGLTARANAVGVTIASAFDPTIGGTTAAQRNVISGNTGDGIAITSASRPLIVGSYIGLTAGGTVALANGGDGIDLGPTAFTAVVGGSASGAGNVISGNGGNGIFGHGANVQLTVLGNRIGTNADGTTAIPNAADGIRVDAAPFPRIGGTDPGAGNQISGNAQNGVRVINTDSQFQGNLIGLNAGGTAAIANQQNGILFQDGRGSVGTGTAASRNVISGNALSGISVDAQSSNVGIESSYIGTNAAGTAAVPNLLHGIQMSGTNHGIGGNTAPEGNLISGNGQHGISLEQDQLTDIRRNLIGTDLNGTGPIPNGGHGIAVADGNRIAIGGVAQAGLGNTIAFNTGAGINVSGAAERIGMIENAIFSNGGLGIDLAPAGVNPNDAGDADGGPNAGQNFPVVTAASSGATLVVAGTLNSNASVNGVRIQVFRSAACDPSGNGEGQTFLGEATVNTNASGDAAWSLTGLAAVPAGTVITATASTPVGSNLNTSEFSACKVVAAAGSGTVTVNPTTGLTTTEAGGTAQFTVVLGSAPAADVTIPLSSSDTTEGTVSPAQLVFTPQDWNVPQAVTVTGADDTLADGDVAYTVVTGAAVSGDPAYSGVNPSDVSAMNQDNEGPARILVSPTQITTTEAGGAAQFTVVLSAVPTANVTIPLSSSDTTEGTLTVTQLVFTPANALTPQVVTVTGVDDGFVDGDVAYTIVTGAGTSGDPAFNGVNPSDVAATNQDNEGPARIVVSPAQITTTEAGGSAQVTVVLSAQPTASVTIALASSDPTEGSLSVAQVVFTPQNWNVPQTVTVTGVNDFEPDGPIQYTVVTGAAASADPAFSGINPSDVAATNLDDDTEPNGANNDGQGESGKPKNEREDEVRETETERQQRERTNRSGSDDFRTEGNVVAVDLEASPRTATIATRDGLQVVVLLCRDGCDDVRVGDYLEADGSKEHEGLFYADGVSSRRAGR